MAGRGVPASLVDGLTLTARRGVMAVTALTIICGILVYPRFSAQLDVGVEPPAASPSGIARREYEQYFASSALQIIAHVRSVDGSSLTSNDTLYAAAANVSEALKQRVNTMTGTLPGKCTASFLSYWELPNVAELRGLFAPQLLAVNDSHALMLATVSACVSAEGGMVTSHPIQPDCVTRQVPWCAPIGALSASFKAYAASDVFAPALTVEIVSLPDVFDAALTGVDKTMRVSSLTAPVAFALLGAVLRNGRLLLITLLNIATCVTATILVMYVVSSVWKVSSQAPALILASALAMSIDYSLFLLSRFHDELHARRVPYRQAVRALPHTPTSTPHAAVCLPSPAPRPSRPCRRRDPQVVTMLAMSGHTVLVSGMALTLCFLGLLLVPVSTIASMGISAAVTVLFAILAALVLTPTLLLAFPAFFSVHRSFGLVGDACCCCELSPPRPDAKPPRTESLLRAAHAPGLADVTGRPADEAPSATPDASDAPSAGFVSLTALAPSPVEHGGPGPMLRSPPEPERRGVWASLALLIFGGLGGVAVPFARPLLQLSYVEGLQPLLPRGDASTRAFESLQAAFGVSNVFPNTIVIVPARTTDVEDPMWLHAACVAMRAIASNVSATLQAQGLDYTMKPDDLSGLMTYGGQCIGWIERLIEALPGEEPKGCLVVLSPRCLRFLTVPAFFPPGEEPKEFLDALIDEFGNADHTATKVRAVTTLNPFDVAGRAWISAMREAIGRQDVVEGVHIGRMYLTGLAPEQMDGAAQTFASLPRVVTATLVIVCLVLLGAFRSLLLPLRAVCCLAWMLVVTFGSAALVYQHGALASLGLGFLTPSGDALFWMSPCIAFSIVVGLGLDYDIFLTEVRHFLSPGVRLS